MNPASEMTVVDQVVLARLPVAGEKGATTTEIKKALDPLLGHRLAGAALADRLAQALAALDSAGLAHRTRKGKTERGTLTPEGEPQGPGVPRDRSLAAEDELGSDHQELPGGPRARPAHAQGQGGQGIQRCPGVQGRAAQDAV